MATEKQRRAALLTLENLGVEHPLTKGEILAKAGYKPSVQDTPQIVTESDGFQALLEELIPDELLAKVQQDGLLANTVISANITYGDADEKTNDFIEIPDHPTRHKFLETALEARGKKKVKDGGNGPAVVINLIKYGDSNNTPQLPA